jgi:quercetin dioxygenase-like cupin family protein
MQLRTNPLIARRQFVCGCCTGAVIGWAPTLAVSIFPHAEAAEEPDNPRIVAVEKASFHLPVFSNEYVTLLNVMLPPGHTSGYHKHSVDTAGVVVEPATVRVQVLGEAAVDRQITTGASSYIGYSKKPLTHIVTNIDSKPLHIILIELLYSTPGRFSSLPRVEVPEYKAELDERVRGWRLVLAPGQSAPTITQQAPGVRIVVNGGILVESEPGQADREINLQRGDFFWQDANATRAVRNAGNTQIELVEFELK